MWKECCKCGKIKCLWEFGKYKKQKFGVKSECLQCASIYNKEYCENNKERLKKYQKEYCENNKERLKKYQKEYNKEYCENNKERLKEKRKEYYENNKEKRKKLNKEYRENNKEKEKEYGKEYRENNKEKRKEYRENNKEKEKEYYKGKCKNLVDPYIRSRLGRVEKVPYEEITPEMIELKRLQLQLHRGIKQGKELIK